MARLSPQVFYQYFTCPHWLWFDRFGDPSKKGEVSELQQKLLEQGVAHEEEFMRDFVQGKNVARVEARDWDAALAETEKFMAAGADVIYQGRLRDKNFEGIPDLLVKRVGKSKFGKYFYEPWDIKSAQSLKDEYKFQLTLYAVLLEAAQKFKPDEAGIITVDRREEKFSVIDFESEFWDVLEKIERICAGEKPPLQLTKSCTQSPWYHECVHQAEEADDIALIYKLDKRSLVKLRELGINTVAEARRADIDALDGEVPFLKRNGLERMKLQAESLQTKKVLLRRAPLLPSAPLEIHFDIEGDPLYGVEYLFGFLLDDGNEPTYKSFVAERPEDEEKMWREFFAWIKTLPENYVVWHYAPYEKARITMLRERYHTDESPSDTAALDFFVSKMFDLNDTMKDSFVFPLYFYGLKDIAKYLGFHWDSSVAGGAQSISWYEDWLQSGDRKILQTILQYNEDDVRATKFLRDWILAFPTKSSLLF